MIPISKIQFSKEEEDAVLEVMRSGKIAQGKRVEQFEKNFAEYIGTRFAVAVSSGTAALHLALLSLSIGKDDEVITTPFSFIASTNAVLYTGAKPVFVDIGEDCNIDVTKIKEKITSKTKAILPVHLYGNPCDMDEIMMLANEHDLSVIEDACQAHGAEYKEKRTGSLGTLGCFSFYATKNMTTAEGGMITTQDLDLYQFLKKARSHGSTHRYINEFLGYNFRMTEIQAAIGIVQLRRLEEFNSKRIENAKYLSEGLKKIKNLTIPGAVSYKKHVFHQYTVKILDNPLKRNEVIQVLKKREIDSAIYYPKTITSQDEIVKMGYGEQLDRAEQASQTVLSLPVHPGVNRKQLDLIIETVQEVLNGN